MGNKMTPEEYVWQCLGEIEQVLENHSCGLSVGEGGELLICHRYKSEDGKDYILISKAFDIAESKYD